MTHSVIVNIVTVLKDVDDDQVGEHAHKHSIFELDLSKNEEVSSITIESSSLRDDCFQRFLPGKEFDQLSEFLNKSSDRVNELETTIRSLKVENQRLLNRLSMLESTYDLPNR